MGGGILEIPIETIYIDDNSASHFRPIKDGIKIYKQLFSNLPKFMIASLSSFVIDYSLFNILFYLFHLATVECTIAARVVSSIFNFLTNKYIVFKNCKNNYLAVKYFLLVIFILLLNSTFIYLLVNILNIPAYISKIITECILYLLSFFIQHRWACRK